MGIAEIRAAANEALPAGYVCTEALLNYTRAGGVESQVLTILISGGGDQRTITSDPIPGQADLLAVARSLARRIQEPST